MMKYFLENLVVDNINSTVTITTTSTTTPTTATTNYLKFMCHQQKWIIDKSA